MTDALDGHMNVTPVAVKTILFVSQRLVWLHVAQTKSTSEAQVSNRSVQVASDAIVQFLQRQNLGQSSFLSALNDKIKKCVMDGEAFDNWIAPSMIATYIQLNSTNSDLVECTFLVAATQESVFILISGPNALVFAFADVMCIEVDRAFGVTLVFNKEIDWLPERGRKLVLGTAYSECCVTCSEWVREQFGSRRVKFTVKRIPMFKMP